ncbi:MAG: 3-beta hydroxysteroid dehydrogenase [Proteobacteria bacterium SG_bin9]|nr:MAG: 3-beta hydroxysteroid dehydrogenase [Proteobacteria bacterium SG_bin9]
MNIAVIGATGNAGSRIVDELLRRNHTVTGIARNPSSLNGRAGVTPKKGDVFDRPGLAKLIEGHDAVVSAVHFLASDPALLIAAVKDAKAARYLVVGGAGSLEVAPGVTLVSTPNFPAQYKAEAEKGGVFLGLLQQETVLNWTFLSPSALLIPGDRTGTFRLGTDQLLTAADGKSSISLEDYAVALVDEIEKPAHIRRRFTVGY